MTSAKAGAQTFTVEPERVHRAGMEAPEFSPAVQALVAVTTCQLTQTLGG